jgi:hypothetical protein
VITIKNYLVHLPITKLALWFYLIWYLVIAAFYFEGHIALWGTSLGISFIVGVALNLSTGGFSRERFQQRRWEIIRLFIIPFCVSSFSALVKGKGFFLIFAPRPEVNLTAVGLCFVLYLVVKVLRHRAFLYLKQKRADEA